MITMNKDKKLKEYKRFLLEDSPSIDEQVEYINEHFISISDVEILIAKEMNIANSEGQPTSRLTSLSNKLKTSTKEDK